jgi:dinuclear metal center YbgI/SA1388 family protein
MRLKKLLNIIEENLPPKTAMEGDKIGLQIQSGREEVTSLLITLELNDEVVEEAKENNIDCIITFHPLIFNPITAIYDDDRVGRLSSKLIKNSIALISIHTNFDAFSSGTSKILADKLKLNIVSTLIPNNEFPGCGMGVIAHPDEIITSRELLDRISSVCNSPIRYCPGRENKDIYNIGIVGGSGSSFIDDALSNELDAFITADITYHNYHKVLGKMMLIDPGHYEMEQFVPDGIAKLLHEKLDKNEYKNLIVSSCLTNPVKYFPDTEIYINRQREFLLNYNKLWCV